MTNTAGCIASESAQGLKKFSIVPQITGKGADRNEFEKAVCEKIWKDLKEELNKVPTDAEYEVVRREVMGAHEPYWKKCIAIYADNQYSYSFRELRALHQ